MYHVYLSRAKRGKETVESLRNDMFDLQEDYRQLEIDYETNKKVERKLERPFFANGSRE